MPLMRIYPLIFVLSLMPWGQVVGQQPPKQFSDPGCGVRFEVPDGWLVDMDKTDTGEVCRLRVHPANLDEHIKADGNLDLYTIEVTTVRGDFQQAAKRAEFELRGNEWEILGRTGIAARAEKTSSKDWIGLKGTATMGCYEVNGGPYVGLCDMPRAMLNNRKQLSAIVQGGPQSNTQFDTILASFAFSTSR